MFKLVKITFLYIHLCDDSRIYFAANIRNVFLKI